MALLAAGAGAEVGLRPLRVVIVVRHLRLRRAIEDLLGHRPGRVVVVGRVTRAQSLARSVGRLAPDVVVASVRTLGREHAAVSAEVGRVSPGSKLILIHPVPVFPCPAQAERVDLPEDDLGRRLWPALERLAGGGGGQDASVAVLGVTSK
jgi:hypothetical protein